MKDLLINSVMNNITRYCNYDDIKLKEIKYGLTSLYLNLTKLVVIFSLSYLLGYIKTLLLLMSFYSILRLTAFGVHAKKSSHCWVASTIIFIILPIVCEKITMSIYIKIAITLICLPLICIYAPADTEKRPLIHKKKRCIYKIASIIISILYIFLIFYVKDTILNNTIIFGLILATFAILPITYKLFGVKYNNYKNYKKGGQ